MSYGCIKSIITFFAIIIAGISLGFLSIGILIFTTNLIKFNIPESYTGYDPEE